MLRTVKGVYHRGRVDLLESPKGFTGDIPVIVTFLPEAGGVDLRTRGLEPAQAADLRARLAAFSEDWEDPLMDIYDERYGRHS